MSKTLVSLRNDLKTLRDKILELLVEFEGRTPVKASDLTIIPFRLKTDALEEGELSVAVALAVRPSKEYEE